MPMLMHCWIAHTVCLAEVVAEVAGFVAEVVAEVAGSVAEVVAEVAGIVAEVVAEVVGFVAEVAAFWSHNFGHNSKYGVKNPN